jgi:hypothetical protein
LHDDCVATQKWLQIDSQAITQRMEGDIEIANSGDFAGQGSILPDKLCELSFVGSIPYNLE